MKGWTSASRASGSPSRWWRRKSSRSSRVRSGPLAAASLMLRTVLVRRSAGPIALLGRRDGPRVGGLRDLLPARALRRVGGWKRRGVGARCLTPAGVGPVPGGRIPAKLTSAPGNGSSQRPLRILAADEDRGALEATADVLRGLGHEVTGY